MYSQVLFGYIAELSSNLRGGGAARKGEARQEGKGVLRELSPMVGALGDTFDRPAFGLHILEHHHASLASQVDGS